MKKTYPSIHVTSHKSLIPNKIHSFQMSLRQKLVEEKHNVKLSQLDLENNFTFSLQNIVVHSKKALWLTGVDQYGFSTGLKVLGFKPFFYSKCSKDWLKDPQYFANKWMESTNDRLRATKKKKNEKGKEEIIQGKDIISHIEIEYRTPFVGFTNGRKDTLLKIFINHIHDYNKVIKFLKEELHWRLYHEDLSFDNQFLQQTSLAYQEWIKPETFIVTPHNEKTSHLNIEVSAHINTLKLDDAMKDKVPMILKAFMRQKAVSREALLKKEAYQYHPDAALPFDRTVAAGISFVWGNGDPVEQRVYTLTPQISGSTFCSTEKNLLQKIRNDIIDFDPDDFIVFPDYYNTLSYLWRRAEVIHCNNFQYLERFRGMTSKHYKSKKDGSWTFRSPSRNYIDLQVNLIKKPFFPIEEYNLYRVSTVKGVRKKPEKLDQLMRYNYMVNQWVLQGLKGRKKIIDFIIQDLNLMTTMEDEMGVRLEKANTSHVADTNITETTVGGELIRVYNRLTHFVIDQGHYVNREKISKQPLRFSKKDRPPSIVDPEEQQINVDLRNACNESLCKNPIFKEMYKKDYKKFTLHQEKADIEDIDMGDEEEEMEDDYKDEEDEKEGGNVLLPSARFWGEEKIIILDFASLYPSIMRAYNISYELLVYNAEYLDLPGVSYYNIPVNNDEVVVLAMKEGIIPKLLALLLSARKVLKKKMAKAAEEGDAFMESVFNMGQASMKVFCNATYGFCGAGEESSILSIKEVMHMVTGIGRYLQKIAADYVATAYDRSIHTIYGDSVTGDTPLLLRCPFTEKISLQTFKELETKSYVNDGSKEVTTLQYPWQVWSDQGWTKINRVIRHKTTKDIYRITTPTGIVETTQDHSLLSHTGECITPTQIKSDTKLLHAFPPLNDKSFVYHTRTKTQKEAQESFLALRSQGVEASIRKTPDGHFMVLPVQDPEDGYHRLPSTKEDGYHIQVEKISTSEAIYVYDLSTENNHFQAGIGDLILHNTDSIFCWLQWNKNDENDISKACEETGKLYGMDGWLKENPKDEESKSLPFTWDNVCKHYCHFRKKRPDKSDVDPRLMSYDHQVNAFIYLIGEKVCEDITKLYLEPILMEFENLADMVCMNPKKKNYCYRFWDEICPDKVKKVKKTGLPAIKREWCLFTRMLLLQVINLFMENKLDEIKPLVYRRVTDLVNGRIPMSQLQISKLFKGKAHYKNNASPHFQLALKIEKRCRYVVPPSRISFVVIRGEGKLYERVETPEYVEKNDIPLDYHYYLKNQLEKPLKKTLLYFYHLFSLDNMFNEMTATLDATENGVEDFNFSDDDEDEKIVQNSLVKPIQQQKNPQLFKNKMIQNRKQLQQQLEDDPMNDFF